MTIAIKVENLSKKYLISHEKKTQGYKTLSESLMQGSKRIANKIIHPFSQSEIDSQTQEEFWALKDINFEINQGDKVGIIGRNGAGKSTLLKVLSRITDPTSGKIHINGRIASLLEVGTGFHPELTGRENIYLNGAILGMSRKEIKLKFDEIVAFAEVEKFLDTPVKRYSSGMYVRLAFAVAAHLESEILVVDEVLAVGDAEFQKKCLGKMDEMGSQGRTVLFVSHNMAMIQKLCDVAILLNSGVLKKHSGVAETLSKYVDDTKSTHQQLNLESMNRAESMGVLGRFSEAWISNVDNLKTETLLFGEPFSITIKFMASRDIENIAFVTRVDTLTGDAVIASSSEDENKFYGLKADEEAVVKVDFCEQFIIPGSYELTISCRSGSQGIDQLIGVRRFSVANIGYQDINVYQASWGSYNMRGNWQ